MFTELCAEELGALLSPGWMRVVKSWEVVGTRPDCPTHALRMYAGCAHTGAFAAATFQDPASKFTRIIMDFDHI